MADDITYVNQSTSVGTSVTEGEEPKATVEVNPEPLPKAIIPGISEEKMKDLSIWLDEWLLALEADQARLQSDWAKQETAYRAHPDAAKQRPYIGADTTVIPAIAMAVDPIHARLDTGIFKQDPVFQVKGLKKSFVQYVPAISAMIDFTQRHRWHLRQISQPRLMEFTKLGTCVFKTIYHVERCKAVTYDDTTWEVVKKEVTYYKGPKVVGISLGDFLFPPNYQFLQDCPVVFERIRTTYDKLKVEEESKRLVNVDKIKQHQVRQLTDLEKAREDAARHVSTKLRPNELIVYEGWCDYDIDGDGIPERLVVTYHPDTRTFLQLRYNWYFHQRKPYTVIPFTIVNDSLYGLGLAEMVEPFQKALTKWHQMATDNAYLANIRMFIVKRESGIEEVPRLYAGRCFFVDDPKSDFIPFAAGEIYPSTLTERQNLFGMVEKRTGVSDYLTGRESPIIGTRATATSTLALIQEGTKRVEEVLENLRAGFSEILEFAMSIWIQYGLDGLDELVFGDDEIGKLLGQFFEEVTHDNVNGALAFDLTATDASGNRQAMQQMQLQIIQIMMQYFEKLLAVGQAAIQPGQNPQFVGMVTDVMKAARQMFRDLLTKYDIRNPDDYIPDLEKYLNGGQPQAGSAVPGGPPGATSGPPGVADIQGLLGAGSTLQRPGVPQPGSAGVGNGAGPALSGTGSQGGY